MSAWVPVADKLPDDDTSVMIACKGNEPVWIGYYSVADWYNPEGEPITSMVTHWMELPEPPKGAV